MRSARLRSGPTALLPPPLALLPSRPPPPGGRTRPPSCGPCHDRLECQCCPSPPPPVGSLELRGWAWGEAAAPAAWLPCAWCCPASAIDDSSPWAPGAGGITPSLVPGPLRLSVCQPPALAEPPLGSAQGTPSQLSSPGVPAPPGQGHLHGALFRVCLRTGWGPVPSSPRSCSSGLPPTPEPPGFSLPRRLPPGPPAPPRCG